MPIFIERPSMRVNTVKTTLGYLRSLFEKYSGISWKARSLSGIYNYHAIELSQDVTINTSGQPTKTHTESDLGSLRGQYASVCVYLSLSLRAFRAFGGHRQKGYGCNLGAIWSLENIRFQPLRLNFFCHWVARQLSF